MNFYNDWIRNMWRFELAYIAESVVIFGAGGWIVLKMTPWGLTLVLLSLLPAWEARQIHKTEIPMIKSMAELELKMDSMSKEATK